MEDRERYKAGDTDMPKVTTGELMPQRIHPTPGARTALVGGGANYGDPATEAPSRKRREAKIVSREVAVDVDI